MAVSGTDVAAPRPRARLVRAVRDAPIPRVWDEDAASLLADAGATARGGAGAAARPAVQVLGGPGTGKTALLVDAAVARLAAGADPESVLVLTQSARAAAAMRAEITRRLFAGRPDTASRATREPMVRTVHSFAFGVLRLHASAHGNPPPQLITGAEKDAVIRELLRGDAEDLAAGGAAARRAWPRRLQPALGLVGFARELRDVMLRAAERGYGPEDLVRLGKEHRRADWQAVGRFAARYEQSMLLRSSVGMEAPQASAPALDAAELVSAALEAFALDPELLAAERDRVRCLLVDDAHHLDPQAAALVRLVAAGAGMSVVAGDGDQQAFRFRGADAAYLDTVAAAGSPQRIVLTTCHRSGSALVDLGARVAARLPGAAPQRGPSAASGAEAGAAAVRVLTTPSHEAALIADALRRAHLGDGVPWSEMAVIVRSVPASSAVLRRALAAAGVPVATASNELPLARQRGASSLLIALRAVTASGGGGSGAGGFTADDALALVSGPVGGADPVALRRLRRGIRRAELDSGRDRDSVEVIRATLAAGDDGGDGAGGVSAESLRGLSEVESAPLRRVRDVLDAGRAALRAGGGVEEVLWALWQTSGLEGRWVADSARGGPAGVQADRDLDAVVALFDAASDFVDGLPAAHPSGFVRYIEDQELPGQVRTAAAAPTDAVSLLSAHSAVGREWDVVAVAAVQEGLWPNLRARGTLLGAEDLVDVMDGRTAHPDSDEPRLHISRTAELLADERRLFLVACTRARRRLLVTAVDSEGGEELVPSRFLEGLAAPPAAGAAGTAAGDGASGPEGAPAADSIPAAEPGARRVLAPGPLVGELRAVVSAPVGSDPAAQERRRRAARQLARLARAGVPGAHPRQWYGLAAVSTGAPLWGADDAAVALSPSNVETLRNCSLRWFLERNGGDDGAQISAVAGTLVHTLVQAVAADVPEDEVARQMDAAWQQVDLGSQWYSRHELERHRGMLAGFRGWLRATRTELTESGVEVAVDVVLEAPEGSGLPGVRLRGRIDRLERDPDGRFVVVDVKTARHPVTKNEAADHAQLAAYQVALAAGAVDGECGQPGGGRLVFVAKSDKDGVAVERVQAPLDDAGIEQWRDVIHEAAETTRGPGFTAQVNDTCRHCAVKTSCPAQPDGRQVTE
ncbi:ATP-dependent DNA helicase [Tomitella gaofuii]|uniref:ATP-dependent DNA helicase n=1 Tax=Tomitella gaofuii TaxID=2760083 RepID=UPI0020C0926E|nr:ATP-dependent DNA helicase [Tomitella gaofuii]